MRKYLRATEFVWMGMTLLALITTIYMFVQGAEDNGVFCGAITLFCAVMWNMRRMFNRRMEREAQKRADEGKNRD